MPCEWSIPESASSLEQGDILMSRDPKTGEVTSILLVITADCDIAHGKVGTHLGCLRIILLQEYIRTFLVDKKLRRALETETEKVRTLLNKWNAERLKDAIPLSSGAVIDWIRASEPDTICSDLQIPAPNTPKVAATLKAFRTAVLALDEKPRSDKLARLSAYRSALSGKPFSECLQSILKQMEGESLPDDVFLLPDLPQLNLGPAIILLRELTGIPISSICFRAVDAVDSEMLLRIGRLDSTFKYFVSQAFGTMYSRIGMPDFYEARRDAVIGSLATLKW